MMKLSFDKRLDEGMMKMYCVDYQINKKVFINSSEISSLRLRWETAVALQVKMEHAGHIIVSGRKGGLGNPCILYFQACRVFGHSGIVQVCFRRNQVQSAVPMEKLREASDCEGKRKRQVQARYGYFCRAENTVAY